jgi:hypothetical protein
MSSQKKNYLFHDFSIIALSIIVALVMVKTDLLSSLIDSTAGMKSLGSFIAGMFFTSLFTTAPAIVALGELAKSGSVIETAIFGAFGAVLGDLLIFRFIRDNLGAHFLELMEHEKWWKRMYHLVFRLKYFRWITFLIGGVIIASPFPDELGISLLGLSKMKTKHFIPISFFFNLLGVLSIGILAKAI